MHTIFFFFVHIISLHPFMMVATSSDFSTLSAFSFGSSVSILSLLIKELFSCCVISFLQSFLIFLALSEPFLNYKPKKQKKQKNPLYHKSKTSFTNQKCSVQPNFKILLKRVLLYMIDVVKVLHHHHFCKNVFQTNLISIKS